MAAKTENAAVTDKVTRPRKSPAEKAQADLDKAQKRYDAAVAKLDKVNASVSVANAEFDEAARFLTFASGSRHLPAIAQGEAMAEPVQSEELFQANA